MSGVITRWIRSAWRGSRWRVLGVGRRLAVGSPDPGGACDVPKAHPASRHIRLAVINTLILQERCALGGAEAGFWCVPIIGVVSLLEIVQGEALTSQLSCQLGRLGIQ
jgi:hypothetical protein